MRESVLGGANDRKKWWGDRVGMGSRILRPVGFWNGEIGKKGINWGGDLSCTERERIDLLNDSYRRRDYRGHSRVPSGHGEVVVNQRPCCTGKKARNYRKGLQGPRIVLNPMMVKR